MADDRPMLSNADVASTFDEIADLLEIQGADSFRVSAYRRVARTVLDLPESVTVVAQRGELAKLPGVGKTSAAKIQELLDSGDLELRRKLHTEMPASLLELTRIAGLGPKRIALLWKERGITSLADLKAALASDGLEGLKGFGAKSVNAIKRGLAFAEHADERRRLSTALHVAEALCERIRALPGVERVEYAGSARRGAETVGDIDLLCVAADGPATVKLFTQMPNVSDVLAAGDTKGSVQFEYRPRRTVQVDLRVVPDQSFGAAWQYFTGSTAHNVKLRERAQKRGLTLNEYGLKKVDDGDVVASQTEQDVYTALDLPWIPPELREDRGEFELTETPPDLLTLADIRADLHMHTSSSDGVHTAEEMIAAARERGYHTICITDHSRSSVIANGLSVERLEQHIAEVREIAQRHDDITVWIGTECDILAAGKLDYPDDLLAQLDWVVASLHAGMGADAHANTERTIAAIESPYVNCIGHPTGRLINRREAMPLDFDQLFTAAAKTGTALEINASAYRLDLRDQLARAARDAGAVISINTDAHAADELQQMRYGVLTARRAWLRRADVLNTWSSEDIRAFVQRKRP